MELTYKLHNGCETLCCKGCGRQNKQLNCYDWLADIPNNAEESEFVEVQFKNTRKGFYRNSNNLPLEKGDIVAVEGNPGHDIGEVTLTGRLVPPIVQSANIQDEEDQQAIYNALDEQWPEGQCVAGTGRHRRPHGHSEKYPA